MSVAVEVGRAARIRNYSVNWKFRIGQVVFFGDLSAVVLSRQCSAMGRQIFYLWIAETDGRQMRWVLGDGLNG